ncbi:MAG: solute carrier family 35 member SLC35F1/F2/F6 [Podila humilis]|nr:MAG: solute carrier family 35 member SLC35F1/F2/F6 [Podila humilis]
MKDDLVIIHPNTSNQDSTQVKDPLQRKTWRSACSHLVSRDFLRVLLLGQILSLCITTTTIFSTKLAQGDNPVSIPTTQSFLNYLVLGLVYTGITIYKEGFRGWLHIMRHRSFYYMVFAVIDVEGNYFMVKAYSYTSLLSAMLLDAWTIPCVVLLSVFFLKVRFIRYHYLGVLIAMAGMGFLIWSDMEAGKNFPGSDYIKGDLFCILAATLYAFSNVYQEFLVRQTSMYEVVGQLGFWATILNGIQLAVLERNEVQAVEWTGSVVGYIVGFDIAMFILYSVSPILFRLSSATFFNLSLLMSDFYGLIFGIFLFDAKINYLYPIAYVLICAGIVVYNIYPTPDPHFKHIFSRNEDDKVADEKSPNTMV